MSNVDCDDESSRSAAENFLQNPFFLRTTLLLPAGAILFCDCAVFIDRDQERPLHQHGVYVSDEGFGEVVARTFGGIKCREVRAPEILVYPNHLIGGKSWLAVVDDVLSLRENIVVEKRHIPVLFL